MNDGKPLSWKTVVGVLLIWGSIRTVGDLWGKADAQEIAGAAMAGVLGFYLLVLGKK